METRNEYTAQRMSRWKMEKFINGGILQMKKPTHFFYFRESASSSYDMKKSL